MLFLDKTRALDLIIANSERISVPEPYRLATVTALAGPVVTGGTPASRRAQPWSWSEPAAGPVAPDPHTVARRTPIRG